MGFLIEQGSEGVRVELQGWDRAMNWRRSCVFPRAQIASVTVSPRGELEPLINYRALGFGTHDGRKRPGRRRVGTMQGRGVAGDQFWAVAAGGPDVDLVVLQLHGHRFARAVLQVDDLSRW